MRLTVVSAAAAIIALGIGAASAQRAAELSDAQVREQIIRESIAAYKASGRPCACPFNLMRNGRGCGDRSAYSKPGGASPLCYDRDVSDAMVRDWQRRYAR